MHILIQATTVAQGHTTKITGCTYNTSRYFQVTETFWQSHHPAPSTSSEIQLLK